MLNEQAFELPRILKLEKHQCVANYPLSISFSLQSDQRLSGESQVY
jgi:hypothetical protein